MKYVVTDKGPLDRLPPGTDVTKLYPEATLHRLAKEGYVKTIGKAEKEAKRDSNQGNKIESSGR